MELITPGLGGNDQRQLLFVDALPAVRVGSDLFAAADGGPGQATARRMLAAPAAARITYTLGWKLYKVWFRVSSMPRHARGALCVMNCSAS